MIRSLILGMMLFAMGLATGSYAQANSFLIPSSDSLNTTTPANLSWVVGRFEVLEAKEGSAKLRNTRVSLLPEVMVSFNKLKFFLKEGETLNLTIRDGVISSIQ